MWSHEKNKVKLDGMSGSVVYVKIDEENMELVYDNTKVKNYSSELLWKPKIETIVSNSELISGIYREVNEHGTSIFLITLVKNRGIYYESRQKVLTSLGVSNTAIFSAYCKLL